MSAPCTFAPHAVTWNRGETVVELNDTVLGEIVAWSRSRCAGEVTSAIWIVPFVTLPQPFEGGGVAAALTTAVGTDVALRVPSEFLALTTTRSVFPASTAFSVYVLSLAPPMLLQLPPSLSHLRHWYVYVIGSVPVHVPLFAVSVCPSVVVPEMVGGAVFVGTADDAAWPGPVTSPATATAITEATAIGMASNFKRRRFDVTGSRVI